MVVRTRDGRAVATFKGMTDPAWAPDGRALAVAGKGQHSVLMLVAEGGRTPVEMKSERGRSMQTSGRITWR